MSRYSPSASRSELATPPSPAIPPLRPPSLRAAHVSPPSPSSHGLCPRRNLISYTSNPHPATPPSRDFPAGYSTAPGGWSRALRIGVGLRSRPALSGGDMKPPASSAAAAGDKGGGVDPSLPRFKCQECQRALVVVGVESFTDKLPAHAVSGMNVSSVQGSVMGASRMDNSYVVLSKQNRSHSHGIPPRPPSAGIPRAEPNQPTRAMEGSYIVLPPAAASIYKTSASEGGGAQLSPTSMNPGSPLPGNNFHSSVTVLKRAFEIATSQTQIEQPLCLDCMRLLSDKMEKEIEDVNTDNKAYEACLQRLEQETYNILSETDFQKERQKVIEEEEKKLKAAIEEAEKQYSEICSEMKCLETKSKQFEELEERYCHDLNSFQFQWTSHQEERDAVLAKIEVSQVHLELLKRTNVLNDAFYISHDGVIGTINNFRLGRLPNVQVEWDEINAAWGQAALLLHTMAQYFFPKFEYRIKIHPMGSYPKVTDINQNTYELFGPVNLFWSTRFDKAMTWFLTCLQEFADFAVSLDKENNVPPDKSLKLPYKIEGDKVGSYTIFLSFNKLDNWTKALKYMLCNLKWVLYWFIGNTSFAPPSGSLHLYFLRFTIFINVNMNIGNARMTYIVKRREYIWLKSAQEKLQMMSQHEL
uniref:Atg6 BARA domain-containing protein n=1 Tax=Oryza nivara TaxID=4536 RepID=A0A0E0G4I4_ORYNI